MNTKTKKKKEKRKKKKQKKTPKSISLYIISLIVKNISVRYIVLLINHTLFYI